MPKQELGSTMYLIKKMVNSYQTTLVISAHGGIVQKKEPQFQIQFGQLHFYSAHGVETSDKGIRQFLFGSGNDRQRTETLRAGDMCYDYSLSKYQGRHSGTRGKPAETYDSIEDDLKYIDEYNALLVEAQSRGRAPQGPQSAQNLDVLTIRNRWWSKDVTLSTALEAVGRVHPYSDVHCYFCRSFVKSLLG